MTNRKEIPMDLQSQESEWDKISTKDAGDSLSGGTAIEDGNDTTLGRNVVQDNKRRIYGNASGSDTKTGGKNKKDSIKKEPGNGTDRIHTHTLEEVKKEDIHPEYSDEDESKGRMETEKEPAPRLPQPITSSKANIGDIAGKVKDEKSQIDILEAHGQYFAAEVAAKEVKITAYVIPVVHLFLYI